MTARVSGRPRPARWLWAVALAGAAVGGCATRGPVLTDEQRDGLAAATDFADETSRRYGLERLPIVPRDTAGFGALWRNGTILVAPRALTADWREALLAHELGHAVLGHGTGAAADPIADTPPGARDRAAAAKELEANAKAVEILTRVKGWTERRSLRAVYWWLLGQHRAQQAGRPVLAGHWPACAEITDLLARFPQHRPVTRYWECG